MAVLIEEDAVRGERGDPPTEDLPLEVLGRDAVLGADLPGEVGDHVGVGEGAAEAAGDAEVVSMKEM